MLLIGASLNDADVSILLLSYIALFQSSSRYLTHSSKLLISLIRQQEHIFAEILQALFARVDSLAIIFWWQWPLRFWTEDRNDSGRVGQTAALTAEGQVAPGGAGFCTQPKGYFNCIVSFRRLRNYHSCSSKKMAKTAISLSNSGVTVRKGRTLAELPNEFAEKQRRGGRLFFLFSFKRWSPNGGHLSQSNGRLKMFLYQPLSLSFSS